MRTGTLTSLVLVVAGLLLLFLLVREWAGLLDACDHGFLEDVVRNPVG